MLTKGLGVAAVASVGAGALLELSDGTAHAASDKPGAFGSGKEGTPAVSATGTNGADGVDASSDSGIGVSAKSTSNTGVSATSGSGTALATTTSTGLAAHFIGGDVNMDRTLNVGINLNVKGEVSGHIVMGKTTNDTAIFGKDDGVGNGVLGSSNRGIGVSAESNTGVGLRADSLTSGTAVLGTTPNGNAIWGRNLGSGLAGRFDGNVQVHGTFSATGTKNFVQAHPSDPSREIVYAALEGGEAGTYVRGTSQLQGGKAAIALPEHFGLVTATEGLTIQLTPRGEWLQLYVVELDTAQLVVREAQGKSGPFDYLIHGVRRGYEQYEVIRTKR